MSSENNSSENNERSAKKPSLFVQVLIGFILGVAGGLFFGELAAPLKIIGDAYIGLLQMTVIPYIVVSLVGGLGRLTLSAAGRMAIHAGKALLALWLIVIVTALLGQMAFPDWESAAFFSTGLTEARQEVDFLELYVPSNPYHSLAAGIVPAIVVFSVALGIALISTNGKETVLTLLSTLSDAIMTISGFIVRLSPIGVFAITASAAGTLQFEEFEQLQIYVYLSIVSWLLLLAWSLPLLVVARTPVRYREVFQYTGSALLTAFATGNLLIVLPMLTEAIKALVVEHGVESEESLGTVDVVVPSAFSLPSAGLFLTLAFVLFAGWFAGSQIDVESYPTLSVVGLFTAFGGTNIAIPFLLDLFRIPIDLFQLYVVSDVVLGRLWTLFAAMFIVVLCILMVFGLEERSRREPVRLLVYAGSTIAFTLISFTVLGSVLQRTISHDYGEYAVLIGMELSRKTVPTTVYDSKPAPLAQGFELSRLEVIGDRGSLRVGYLEDALPFVFRNDAGELVGLDIEMANSLSRDLGVDLELAKLRREDIVDWLQTGRVDIVMSGLPMTPDLARRTAFTKVYLEQTLAFVVKDHRRREFTSMVSIGQLESLRLAVPDIPFLLARVADRFPHAELEPIDSPRAFFRDELPDVDALVFSAEAGSTWTLVYPAFSVAVPEPLLVKIPIGYALPSDEPELAEFIDVWLELRIRTGDVDELFEHWILGEGATTPEPRWSVIRNVLHWVD